jgi:hypothetical protein
MNTSSSQVQDSASALLKLMECLVLSFTYSEQDRTFVLVCDFPVKAPGSSRAFVRCHFSGVREFVREPGDLKRLGPFGPSFELRTITGSVVIQLLKLDGNSAGGSFELGFGWNFGGLRFKYDSVIVHTRNTKAVKRGDETHYFDLVTGDPIDFYDPFG